MILVALALSATLSSAAPDSGAAWLAASVGLDGFDLLQQRGLIVAQGKPGERAVRWLAEEGLADLVARADGLVSLESAWSAYAGGRAAQTLRPLPNVLLSPAARAAAQLLAAFPADLAELGRDEIPVAQILASTTPLLFETSWGRDFAARSHADVADDAGPLARPFFDAYLAGVRPNAAAVRHFLAVVSETRKIDAAAALSADAVAGMPSEQLRAWLARYLSDQRRLLALKKAAAELQRLDRSAKVSAEIALAGKIGRAIGANRDWLGALKAAAPPTNAPEGPAKLSSSGLHLGKPAGLNTHEMGDQAVVTGAAWVDGLAEGKSTEIEQTTFLAFPLGALDVQTSSSKRAGGGPYDFARAAALSDSRSFTFHSILCAPGGAVVSDALEVPTAADFESALGRLGEADARAQSCDFKEADTAYAGLRAAVADAAARKRQYAELVKRIDARREDAARQAAALTKVEEAIAAARPDASPDVCRYDASRTQEALSLARALPAGCGRFLPELESQLSAIRRRAVDQRAFNKAAA